MADDRYEELTARFDRMERLLIASQKEVLTMEECSIYTGLSVRTLYNMTMAKEVPYYKPRGGHIYFKKSELDDWMLQNRQSTKAEIDSIATTYCVTKGRLPRKTKSASAGRSRTAAGA